MDLSLHKTCLSVRRTFVCLCDLSVCLYDVSISLFVGVSKVDLCLQNCTWADSMTIDLYPWDAGTDSGISYFVSPCSLKSFTQQYSKGNNSNFIHHLILKFIQYIVNWKIFFQFLYMCNISTENRKIRFCIELQDNNIETDPPEKIQPITNRRPNHPGSPFFAKDPIKPMARLTLTKTKDICTSDGKKGDSDENTMSTSELIKLMKKKMMMKKKIGKAWCESSRSVCLPLCETCCVIENIYLSLHCLQSRLNE